MGTHKISNSKSKYLFVSSLHTWKAPCRLAIRQQNQRLTQLCAWVCPADRCVNVLVDKWENFSPHPHFTCGTFLEKMKLLLIFALCAVAYASGPEGLSTDVFGPQLEKIALDHKGDATLVNLQRQLATTIRNACFSHECADMLHFWIAFKNFHMTFWSASPESFAVVFVRLSRGTIQSRRVP